MRIRNIIVSGLLAGPTTAILTPNIFIDFPVKEIIVQGVSFTNSASTDDFITIFTDLVAEGQLVAFPTNVSDFHDMDIKFLPNSSKDTAEIRGQYQFRLIDNSGALADLTGKIAIHLSFRG